MAEELTPDLCVVGGGPAGIAAARAAIAEGMTVVLVERARLGGANLASGTVPSKALVAAADIYESLRIGPALGVSGAPLQVNLGKVREHIEAVTAALARNVSAERLTAQGITVIEGAARFADAGTLTVGEQVVRPRRIVLAVGSEPAVPAIPGLDTVDAMTPAFGAFDLARKPAHLIVLGAGPYALELAQANNRLGIDATVIAEGPALPGIDPELAAIVVDRLRAEGIRVRVDLKIGSVARRKGGIRILVEDPAERSEGSATGEIAVDGSHLLIVGGRTPDVDGLNLAAAGIAYDGDGIAVDRNLRTANRRVYAIGDAVAGPPSAARAEHQAALVVKSIVSRWPSAAGAASVPLVAFTDPGLATVGLTESEAQGRRGGVRTLRVPFLDNDRAEIERLPAGVIKVVTADDGRILGAAIVGRNAAELIAPWSLAVANRLSLAAMALPSPPYPSRSEIVQAVAALPEAGLTTPRRRRIIDFLRIFG